MAGDFAVVTGAGGGLGRALCAALAAKGVSSLAIGRKESDLRETAALSPDGRIAWAVADVADARAVEAAFARLDAEGRPATILFNNAAIYPKGDFLDAAPGEWMRSVEINLGGVVNCASSALKRMAETGRGRIINVATFADIAPISGASAYAVSKGAARIFTKALKADIWDRFPGIVVCDWVPGELATGMGRPDGISPARAAEWGVRLALMDHPGLNGATFFENRQQLPPRSLKKALLDRLLMRAYDRDAIRLGD